MKLSLTRLCKRGIKSPGVSLVFLVEGSLLSKHSKGNSRAVDDKVMIKK